VAEAEVEVAAKTKNLKKEGNPPPQRNPAADQLNLLPINPAEVPPRNLRPPNPPAVKNPVGRRLRKSDFSEKSQDLHGLLK
jgi:hypothetical protein